MVARVGDQEPAKLRYLAALGLVPGAHVVVLEKAPFAGPLRLCIGQADQIIGYELAHAIFMAPASDGSAPRPPDPAGSAVR